MFFVEYFGGPYDGATERFSLECFPLYGLLSLAHLTEYCIHEYHTYQDLSILDGQSVVAYHAGAVLRPTVASDRTDLQS